MSNINFNNIERLETEIILFRQQLIRDYGKYVPKDVLETYLPPELSVIVNDDPDMYPVEIELPIPPELHKIDGFGLLPHQQFFRIPSLPKKLTDLISTSSTEIEIWQKIDSNRRFYREEIFWIQKQWYYRLNGYWFWNNGIPTFIDGVHYYYCGYWDIDNQKPQYRYRDRLFFLFQKYCMTTTEAPFFYRVNNSNISDDYYYYFSDLKEAETYIGQNQLLKQAEQGIWMIDYGKRVCYGFNYPKHRREGATSKACSSNNEIVSRSGLSDGVILSKDGSSAQKTFGKQLILPIKRLPFFFKPHISTSSLSETTSFLNFDIMSVSRLGQKVVHEKGLESTIHPITNTDERKEDGNKYIYVHGDEVGKENPMTPYDLLLRHNVMMKTIAQGSVIFGLMVNTSTSDDTKGDAGRRYMELCRDSHWHKRSYVNGQTQSGLFNFFLPADMNLEGYSDFHGNPIITNPTPEQQKYCKSKFGAREYIENKFKQLINSPDQYYNEMREHPLRFRHCFMSSGEDSGFDLMAIVNRINEIDMNDKNKPRVGNFEWVDGWGSTVQFIDRLDGKFELSYFPSTPNKMIKKRGKLYPANTDQFVAACDPFRFDDTRKKRRSKGAGAVYLKRDFIIDPLDKEISKCETDRYVCTYSNAVKEAEYKEDMLKMSIFFGCEMFPEMNEEMVYKYFRDSKYRGFLGYLYIDGKRQELPGFYTQSQSKQRMFKLWKMKIETKIGNERHRQLLQELADIESLKDMVNYDLFAAAGGCLLAMYYSKAEIDMSEAVESDDMLSQFINRARR